MWGHACAVVAVTPLAQTAVATALLFWPWMLLWLPAVLLPFIIAQWTSVRAREVSWGPIEIVAAAARRQGLTRDGWSWPLIMLRVLMLLLAVIAAARPLLGRPALPEIVVERIAAGTGRGPSARRILLVEPDRPTGSRPAAAAAASAVRPALLALAQAGGFTPPGEAASRGAERRATIPAIAAIASRDLAAALAEQGSPPERSLVVLTDGAPPLDAGAVDGAVAQLEQAVKGGGSLLVLLGPQTVSATGQSAFLSWLEACCGVSVGAPARGAGARLEVDAALAAPDRRTAPDDFVVLNGPTIDTFARVSQTARATAGHSDPTVLARTVPAGDPLIVECSVGRGRVCIVAIPCALPGPDAWSDLSIWPGFVPLIDGLTTRLLETAATAGSSEAEAALGSTPRRSESRWWAALPPARLLLAAAIMLAILDPVVSALLSHRGARTAAPLIPSGGIGRLFRPTIPVVLLALLLGAGQTPMDQADARRDVALLIDVSPSMATEDAHALTDRTASISRLQAVREGLTTPAAGRALATLRAANRDLSITTVGDEFLPLDAADLPNLAPLAPRPNASRLGDAVIRAGTRAGAPPAAIVIASDGAITQGANWAEATRAVAAHDIPLIAIPVGDRGTTGSAAGITIVAAAIPRVAWRGERRAIEVVATGNDPAGENARVVLTTRDGRPLGEGMLTRQPRPASSSAADSVRFTGTLSWAPAAPGPQTLVVHPGRVDEDASRAVVGSTLVTDEPIRVLLVDAAPRFEFRFLEQTLAGDSRFRVESCLLDKIERVHPAAGGDPARLAAPLPKSVADWCRFDVVVLGDLTETDLPDDSARSLLEACRSAGPGIAWSPGRRWSRAGAGDGPLHELLPATPAAGTGRLDSIARRLHILPAGWESGWFPALLHESTSFGRRLFESAGPVRLRPSARVLAIAQPSEPPRTAGGPPASPAVVIDRSGAAPILAHFCDTWRFRDGAADGYAAYWHNALLQLSEQRLLSRLVPALIDLRPERLRAGDTATVVVVPTRGQTDVSGWQLVHRAPSKNAEHFDLRGTPLPLSNLIPGWHSLSLVGPSSPPPNAGQDSIPAFATLEFFVSSPLVERPGPPAHTQPMLAAAQATGGEVLAIDDIPRLAETLDRADAVRRQSSRTRLKPSPLANLPATNLLMLALLAACAWDWSVRVRGGMP